MINPSRVINVSCNSHIQAISATLLKIKILVAEENIPYRPLSERRKYMENLALWGEDVYMTGDGEKKVHTVEEILALPEGERAELIDGEMFMMASPTVIHQEVSGWINMEIRQFISKKAEGVKFSMPLLRYF